MGQACQRRAKTHPAFIDACFRRRQIICAPASPSSSHINPPSFRKRCRRMLRSHRRFRGRGSPASMHRHPAPCKTASHACLANGCAARSQRSFGMRESHGAPLQLLARYPLHFGRARHHILHCTHALPDRIFHRLHPHGSADHRSSWTIADEAWQATAWLASTWP